MATYTKKGGKNLEVKLDVMYGSKHLMKNLQKTYSEEFIQIKEVDSTDSGVQLVAFNDSSFLASSLKNSKGLLICNEGEVSAELTLQVATWAAGTPDTASSGGGQQIKKVLNAGEYTFLPNIAMLDYGTSATSSALGASLDNQVPSSTLYVDSGATLATDLEDTEDHIQVNDIAFFEVGDLVQVGINDTTATRIEVMEVTKIVDASGTDDDAGGELFVRRALYGTSKADKDSQTNGTNGAVSGAKVYFPTFNAYHEYNTQLSGDSQLLMSDGQGRFKIGNFFGYARTAVENDEGQGIVPGSVAIKFYNNAFHDIKFQKPISNAIDTKLTANTAFAFDLTIDDSSATNIAFTTGTDTTFSSVIPVIQDAIDVAFESLPYACNVSIVNGNLRFTSLSHMAPHDGTNGSKVLVADASSGTDIFTGSVGIFPNDTAFPSPVEPYLPDDDIIDPSSFRTTPNVDVFMYDDGHGNLYYKGAVVGQVSYLSGALDFTIPNRPYGQFVLNATYNSALSGGVKVKNGHEDTGISSITGRSMNTKINTNIGIYAFN